jgi:energy-coupling factor transporter transmembrane protein EcfT
MNFEFSFGAAIASIAFLLVGMVVAWIAGRQLKIAEGTGLLALILMPFVAYLVFSGSMESFKGGGLEWKLRTVATAPASGSTLKGVFRTDDLVEKVLQAEDTELNAFFGIPVEAVIVNTSKWAKLSDAGRVQMTLRTGEVIYQSILAGSFKCLVIVDSENRPMGLFEKTAFLDLLRVPYTLYPVSGPDTSAAATSSTVYQMLQQTELWIILKNPDVRALASGSKAVLSSDTSRIEALKTMSVQKWQAAVLTNPLGKLESVVWLPTLLETSLLELLETK